MMSDNFIGRHIKDYVIEERIGRGGMATVYRAYQPAVNRQIALKIIRLEGDAEEDEFRQRFAQEAELIARLEHIHILPVYDYGIVEDIAYIAMRYLRGGTLADLLENGPLSLDRTAELFGQFARALAYAHSKGIIHRDLKPSNIMLDDSANAYLTDFGLAKLVEGSTGITKSGNIVGTPAYMSPEQLRGDEVDHRADIYSLGIILYHMVVGHPPFQVSTSNDIISIIYQHLEKVPTPPREIDPTIPDTVEFVILQALEKHPANRFDSALRMADELDIALGRKVSSSQYPAAITPRHLPNIGKPQSKAKVRKLSRSYLLLGMVVGVILAGVIISRVVGFPQLLSPTPGPIAFASAAVVPGIISSKAAIPSEAEIRVAQERLGADGFIAYVTCTQDSEYHATQAREMRDFARAFGLDLRIYDSEEDKYRQVTLIERARSDGAKALIICPLEPNTVENPIKSAMAAGIPVLPIHSELSYYEGVHLEGDNYTMGFKPGQYAAEVFQEEMEGDANVVILDYPDLPSLVERADGLEEGFLQIIPDAHIIGRFLGATPENAEKSISKLIDDGVEFNVILSLNDAGSFGAIKAMEDADFTPDSVIVTSVDAEALAQEYILKDYFMRASVDVGREKMSHTVINLMVKMLAGSTLPRTIVVEPGDLVTKETLKNQR